MTARIDACPARHGEPFPETRRLSTASSNPRLAAENALWHALEECRDVIRAAILGFGERQHHQLREAHSAARLIDELCAAMESYTGGADPYYLRPMTQTIKRGLPTWEHLLIRPGRLGAMHAVTLGISPSLDSPRRKLTRSIVFSRLLAPYGSDSSARGEVPNSYAGDVKIQESDRCRLLWSALLLMVRCVFARDRFGDVGLVIPAVAAPLLRRERDRERVGLAHDSLCETALGRSGTPSPGHPARWLERRPTW